MLPYFGMSAGVVVQGSPLGQPYAKCKSFAFEYYADLCSRGKLVKPQQT